MTDNNPFQITQGLFILLPKSGEAYPISCDEWTSLKEKTTKLTLEPWFFRSAGLLLLGAAISTFLAILLGTFQPPAQPPAQHYALVVAWAVVAVTFLCGAASLLFAHKERAIHRERATDVVAQMELIEKRYQRRGGTDENG